MGGQPDENHLTTGALVSKRSLSMSMAQWYEHLPCGLGSRAGVDALLGFSLF